MCFPPSICWTDLIHNLSNFSQLISLYRKKDVAAEFILGVKSVNLFKKWDKYIYY